MCSAKAWRAASAAADWWTLSPAGWSLGLPSGSSPAAPLNSPEVSITCRRPRCNSPRAPCAGARILLKRLGAEPGDVRRIYLAGAFGNYINRESARRIGLIEFPPELIEPAGNTALLGAKLALFGDGHAKIRVEHIPLASDAEFQDTFVESMLFPQ
jgi:hypothetical protein